MTVQEISLMPVAEFASLWTVRCGINRPAACYSAWHQIHNVDKLTFAFLHVMLGKNVEV